MTALADRRRSLLGSAVILAADVVLEVARVDRQEGRPPTCRWCRQHPGVLLIVAELELTCVHAGDCEVCSGSLGEAETVVCGRCLTAAGAGDLLSAVDLAGASGGWERLHAALSGPLCARLGLDRAAMAGVVRVTLHAAPDAAPVTLLRPPRAPAPPDGDLVAEEDDD